MGGGISFVSKEGVGTTFRFHLNLDVLERTQVLTNSRQFYHSEDRIWIGDSATSASKLKDRRVLIVDSRQVRQQVKTTDTQRDIDLSPSPPPPEWEEVTPGNPYLNPAHPPLRSWPPTCGASRWMWRSATRWGAQ